ALCIAGVHVPHGDDPLAPPIPAPPLPSLPVVEDRSHEDEDEAREEAEAKAQELRDEAAGAAHAAETLRRAKPGDRNVVLGFATSHCQPCRALLSWLQEPVVSRALAADYAVVTIDHDADDSYYVCEAYAGRNGCPGWPVVVVVAANGTRLAPVALG